jgi:hypothetical protein
MNRMQRRTALKVFGATAAGIAAQFSGFLPELLAVGAPEKSDINWRELTAGDLRQAVRKALGSSDGSRLAKLAGEEGFVLSDADARGLGIRTASTSGALVVVPFRSPDGRSAQLLYADGAARGPRVALGVVDQRTAGKAQISARIVEGDQVLLAETSTIESDTWTITDHRTGSTRTVKPPTAPASGNRQQGLAVNSINFSAVAAADSCDICRGVFLFLYGLGCTFTATIACFACGLLSGPGIFICGLVCAFFWYLVCYLGQATNSCMFCGMFGYCTSC